MPKVTIIIPVYNAETFLASALDSVLSQSLTDIEVICVDDGSTDNSANILADYAARDSRVIVITQKNSGGSAARNSGIDRATGEYIMFLDADDLYASDIVSRAYHRAVDTQTDIVFYNFARFVGKPSRLAVKNKHAPTTDINVFTKETYAERFFNDFAIITWNKLIKRDIIERHALRFDSSLSHNHDVDFSVRIMVAAESYSWLSDIGYYYRSNNNGITATKRSDPTNVLKILGDLNRDVVASYPVVVPSFHQYITDMVIGTIMKYRGDSKKVRQICQYTHDTLIPELGKEWSVSDIVDATGIIHAITAAEYDKVIAYINHPTRIIRRTLRDLYDRTQAVLSRFTV